MLHHRIRKCDESPDACFLGLPGQECQWSFQCVREIPGRSLGLANRSFALLQKIIQVVHQRLHFAGICALQASRPAITHVVETITQQPERRDAAANLADAQNHQAHCPGENRGALYHPYSPGKTVWV